jgi:hypothetical protein
MGDPSEGLGIEDPSRCLTSYEYYLQASFEQPEAERDSGYKL